MRIHRTSQLFSSRQCTHNCTARQLSSLRFLVCQGFYVIRRRSGISQSLIVFDGCFGQSVLENLTVMSLQE